MAGEAESLVKTREIRCQSCGAPWEMRGFRNTRTVACANCGSIFDCSGEQWQLVQQVQGAYENKPRYALGTRGRLDGIEWEVIGWVERSVTAWGTRFAWEEHLLFNPYEGFRYLVYSDGHFAVVEPCPGVPTLGANQALYEGRTYKHFSTAEAVVDEVVGEFPWEVRRGDVVAASDFVDPPYLASCEESEGEVNWTVGRYLTHDEVVAAFGRPTRPIDDPQGIHPCQPNPHRETVRWMGKMLVLGMLAWALLTVVYMGSRANQTVWSGALDGKGVEWAADGPGKPVVGRQTLTVQDVKLEGSAFGAYDAPLRLSANAPQLNGSVFVAAAFINPATEQARYVALELDYSAQWKEGDRSKEEVVRGIPNGKYTLQVETQWVETPGEPSPRGKETPVQISLTRDVPLWRYPCCALVLLFFVPFLAFARSRSFEATRWAESDHAAG